ncbi:tetratricopeptide repeat protein [Ruegeria hyattellae]|uniref:tetratricopeptide repeat protein n=1 Tax=Ruegeria hyattellae TaxID=3233337 RepID=UPI00355B4C32
MKRIAAAALFCICMSPVTADEYGSLNPEEDGPTRLAENIAAHPDRIGMICWVNYEIQKGGGPAAKQALDLMETYAESGNEPSMIMLSHAYKNGLGTERSPEKSTYWVHQAALAGYSLGAYHYGVAMLNGYGTAPNQEEAMKWLKIAADDGIEDAAAVLAKLGKG